MRVGVPLFFFKEMATWVSFWLRPGGGGWEGGEPPLDPHVMVKKPFSDFFLCKEFFPAFLAPQPTPSGEPVSQQFRKCTLAILLGGWGKGAVWGGAAQKIHTFQELWGGDGASALQKVWYGLAFDDWAAWVVVSKIYVFLLADKPCFTAGGNMDH